MTDDLSSSLKEAKRVADGLHFACRKLGATPDFTACGGPAAEAYWEYFTPARILSLIAAIDEQAAALERHMQESTVKGLRMCMGCLEPAPCPDSPEQGRVAAILNGESHA